MNEIKAEPQTEPTMMFVVSPGQKNPENRME